MRCSTMALRIMLLLCVLTSYHGFNLDVEEPMVFQEDGAGFGQSVAQLGGSRLVVGAPLEVVAVNQTGRLYDCVAATGLCQPIPLHTPPDAVNMSLGLSLSAAASRPWLLACGPTMHRACGENMYAEGFCLLLDSHLQTIWTVPAALPECPSQEMDIVFLIDGSGSIYESSFKQMKDFVRALMGHFEGTNTLFSLIQYSHLLKIHFTFTQFQNSWNPLSLVDPIVQLKGLTYTATGIRKVVEELFHSKNGARKSAKKILIVITDGQKYKDPLEYSDVIPQAERAGIIRYAIGVCPLPHVSLGLRLHLTREERLAGSSSVASLPQVGDAFWKPSAKQELDNIGSEPAQDHVFRVDNFAALSSIQEQLQEKIFALEGTQSTTSSSFQHEMSQEGFSSVLTMDGPVLGAVGSFSWSGGAFLYPPKTSPTFINMSQENVDMRDSYLGYSTELAFWKGVQSLILGAPRHQHTGKVVIFTQASEQWRPKAEVSGTQIGSYFGASLCTVDVDRDGNTDLVLIGAPHYYKPTQGGQVSVCPLPQGRAKWQCEVILRGEQGHPWGRFGAALTLLGDVNGDKLTDVAIGAPGEQENRGAVYLFHGTSGLGISPSHSQLPFEKNCGQDHFCKGDLSVNLSSSSLQTLVVGSSLELNVTVTLWNEGEDSYRTVIHFYYPAGLSYRRVLGTQQPHQRPLRLACEAVPTGNEGLRSSSCSINHPIFHEGTKGIFIVTFDVSYKATLGNKLLLRANASSQNNKPSTSKTTSQLELPVKYAVYMVISRQEDSTKYFNFSTSDEKSKKEAEHRYRVNNLSQRDVVISINVWVPILLNGVAVWDVALLDHSQSLTCVSEREPPQDPDFLTQIPGSLVLNCSIADCLKIHCDLPSFGIQEELEFTLKGNLNFGWVSQTLQKKVLVVSVAEITFNRSVYSQLPGQEAFLRAQMETVLEKYEVYNPIPIIAGSSVGGLLLLALITAILYKVGFFKRQYKEMMAEANGQIAPENGTSDPQVAQ
eukprot:XP_013969833.1 integrin alpha-D-like isoform X4 [Canis lupus familiaris]